jgi:hypothetical protein
MSEAMDSSNVILERKPDIVAKLKRTNPEGHKTVVKSQMPQGFWEEGAMVNIRTEVISSDSRQENVAL